MGLKPGLDLLERREKWIFTCRELKLDPWVVQFTDYSLYRQGASGCPTGIGVNILRFTFVDYVLITYNAVRLNEHSI
jgi:hypothetical protein